MNTFHIRQQLAKRKGNQFYKDRAFRNTATLCGAPVTEWDITFRSKIAPTAEFICCDKCQAIRNDLAS